MKEGGIAIKCRSEEDNQKLKDECEKIVDYDITMHNRNNPCVKIIGIELK